MRRNHLLPRSLAVLASLIVLALPATAQVSVLPENVQVDRQPVPLTQVTPVWPAEARRDSAEGRVTLKVLLGPDGRVAQVQHLRTTVDQRGERLPEQNPYAEAFAASAEASVRQWTFSPAVKDEKPVAAWFTVPFRFRLSR
jgi:outer membrane biosynthesis protein TonB